MLDKLSEMRAFQAVADAGSFTAAAGALGVSQSMVSRAVVRLEERLGASLLHRSTRRLSLTDEGEIFLQACRRVLEDIGEAEQSVRADALPVGALRVSAAVLWGQDAIVPHLPEFMARYPKLEVHLSLEDRHVDLIEEKIDVAIRLGRLADSSLVARKIGEVRRIIVASPAYLARQGRPSTPDDLLKHDCLLWDEEHDYLNRWPFDVHGVIRRIKVRGRVVSNNTQAHHLLATKGVGISRMPEHHARPFVRRGELIPVLDRWHCDEAVPAHALYLRTNIARPRVRVFVDFLAEKFAADSSKGSVKPPSSSRRRRPKQGAVA
jgi:DNA-binding transcriptional LysR family regulator